MEVDISIQNEKLVWDRQVEQDPRNNFQIWLINKYSVTNVSITLRHQSYQVLHLLCRYLNKYVLNKCIFGKLKKMWVWLQCHQGSCCLMLLRARQRQMKMDIVILKSISCKMPKIFAAYHCSETTMSRVPNIAFSISWYERLIMESTQGLPPPVK